MKPALAAARSMRVLSFLTVNPRTAFTLSELSAALDVSPASLSAILLAMTDAGYLVRHPRHKTYELGMAGVAVGNAAGMRHPVVELARAEMPALAALGTACVGSAIMGEDIAVLAITGRTTSSTREVHLGQRVPIVPPYGQVFLAWSPAATIERWLTGMDPDAGEAESLLRSLAFTRALGFTVVLDTEAVAAVQHLFAELARRPWDEEVRARIRTAIVRQAGSYAVDALEPGREYRVDHMAAPVFGVDGSVVFALTVHGLGARTGAELLRIGREIADVGLTLTRAIDGRAPRVESPSP